MRILIDTHILIWYLEGDDHLSPARRRFIADSNNEVLISIASVWEIAIKLSNGKLSISKSIAEVVSNVEQSTSSFFTIEPKHLIRVAHLPFHHKDPFDRLIIAQSLVDGLPIITSDSNFADYGVELL